MSIWNQGGGGSAQITKKGIFAPIAGCNKKILRPPPQGPQALWLGVWLSLGELDSVRDGLRVPVRPSDRVAVEDGLSEGLQPEGLVTSQLKGGHEASQRELKHLNHV